MQREKLGFGGGKLGFGGGKAGLWGEKRGFSRLSPRVQVQGWVGGRGSERRGPKPPFPPQTSHVRRIPRPPAPPAPAQGPGGRQQTLQVLFILRGGFSEPRFLLIWGFFFNISFNFRPPSMHDNRWEEKEPPAVAETAKQEVKLERGGGVNACVCVPLPVTPQNLPPPGG